jgi:5-methylcytosine-specific restriction endonuclease McrA
MATAKRVSLGATLREEVLLSGDCAYCGSIPTQIDHVIPLSRGGTDDRSNLAPSCRMCNMEKLDFTPDEWREWRRSEGLEWPPKSMGQQIREWVAEYRAKQEARRHEDL